MYCHEYWQPEASLHEVSVMRITLRKYGESPPRKPMSYLREQTEALLFQLKHVAGLDGLALHELFWYLCRFFLVVVRYIF